MGHWLETAFKKRSLEQIFQPYQIKQNINLELTKNGNSTHSISDTKEPSENKKIFELKTHGYGLITRIILKELPWKIMLTYFTRGIV